MKTQTLKSATRRALFAAAFCAAALPSLAEDWTVSENTTLTADTTVDALTVNSGVTLDLAGYKLTCSSLAGSGTITSLGDTTDLTSPSGTVTWSTNGGTAQTASGNGANLFNNTTWTKTDVHNNAKRIMVATANLPLAVTYDFGEGTTERVNKYKMYFGSVDFSAYNDRGPKDWVFEGSNDNDVWTRLDTQTGITWANRSSPKSFSFENATPYRYYRITFTASKDTNLELNMLEYFNTNPGELHVNVASGQTASSSVTISGNVKVVKEGAGTLGGVSQIASETGSTVELAVDGGSVILSSSTLYVGYKGAGTLTVNGGTVEVKSSDQNVNLAQQSGSSGAINLNGGTLKTRRVVKNVAAASGELNFNGGTLQANSLAPSGLAGGLIASSVTTTVKENGGTIDSGSFAIKVGAAIHGTGAMRFKGGGSIQLLGASDYAGGTTIELGTKIITSDETAKNAILGNLVIDGKTKTADENGIVVFEYSGLADEDVPTPDYKNCGPGTTIYRDGDTLKVNFVLPVWELTANATWSSLVATYGTPAADAVVRIASSGKYTLTINTDVTVSQIVFTGTNPDVVVNSGCTVTADTITFSGSGANYLKNDGVVVLNGTGTTELPFHNDSRGVYYVNNGRLNVSGVTQGSTTPGLVPGGANQFVNVASGAMYDVHGVADNTASVRLAAGATVANGGTTSITTGNKQIPQLILDGDATARIFRSFGLSCEGHSETRLDLGAHTLTVAGGGNTYSFFLDNTTVSGTGKILVEEGKLCAVENAGGEEFTLEIGPSGQLVLDKVYARPYADFTVGNFVNNGTDSSGNDAGTLIVKGTLTPGNAIKKLTLANGSTVKASATVTQMVSTAFSASGTVYIDAADITAQQLKDAPDGRIAVMTAPGEAATLNASASWRVANEPIVGCRAKWVSNGDGTSTLYLAKPTGLMVIFR